MKVAGAKVDDSTFDQFKRKCQEYGLKPSDYLRKLITNDLRAGAKEPQVTTQEKPKSQPKISSYMPPYVAKFRCKCGDIHENENYQGPAKGRCDTCSEKFHGKVKGKCPYCRDGEIEPLDETDIEDMGLYT